MTTDERIADLEEQVAFWKREAGSVTGDARIATLKARLRVSPKEAELLMVLYEAHGIVSKERANLLLKGYDRVFRDPKTIDVWVCRLRRLLGADIIETVWSSGYLLTDTGRAVVDSALTQQTAGSIAVDRN